MHNCSDVHFAEKLKIPISTAIVVLSETNEK